jgi:hypothetical protein
MTHPNDTDTLLDEAAGHLRAAADLAEARGGPDVFSEWHGLASQISLTASGVSHYPAVPPQNPSQVSGALRAAIDTLDGITPLSGPPDLVLWIWHIRELLHLALDMELR